MCLTFSGCEIKTIELQTEYLRVHVCYFFSQIGFGSLNKSVLISDWKYYARNSKRRAVKRGVGGRGHFCM